MDSGKSAASVSDLLLNLAGSKLTASAETTSELDHTDNESATSESQRKKPRSNVLKEEQ